MRKTIVGIIVLIAALGGLFVLFTKGGAIKDLVLLQQRKVLLPPSLSYEQAKNQTSSNQLPVIQNPVPSNIDSLAQNVQPQPSTPSSLPASINLDVPFTPQAPFAVWDAVHEDACEEVSILMVAHYKQGRDIGSPSDAEQEILKIVDTENKLVGFNKDTTAEETMRIANAYYGFQHSRLVYDFSVDDIKSELAAGNPVIIPAQGQLLHNPYFRSPGPVYHMLVIRGYTADGIFITNDPGTRRGEEFTYTFDTIMNAAHDWNGGDVKNGKKVMIVLE